ncbi:hypothetical protein BH09PSE3_BH09PSE3_25850 [soil metagenome]
MKYGSMIGGKRAMASISMNKPEYKTVGRPFYLLMSLAMAAVIIGGFSYTVPGDFIRKPGLPLLFHVHGAVFTSWVILFVAQPAFIARGSVSLHRKIGWIGAAIALAMLVMGVAATLYAVRYNFIPGFFPPQIFLVMNLIGIATFAGLFAGGIALRKRAEWHKRLMLCATISILGPGVGRLLPMDSFGPAAPLVMFGVIALFAFAGPVADLIVRRSVHRAYYWGVAAILISMAIVPPIAFSPPAGALLAMVRSV